MNEPEHKAAASNELWAYIKVLIMLASIVLAWWVLGRSELSSNIDNHDWVKLQIDHYGLYGPLLFIAISGLGTVIGVPRLLISAVAGFSFSFVPAVTIALASTMVGCIISFYYARLMGRSVVRNIMSLRLKNIEGLLMEHGFVAGISIRAIPISNNSIVNLLAGVTGVRPMYYFAGSLIGYIPLTVVFVLAGSGVQQDLLGRILFSLLLYLFVVIPVGYIIQKRVVSRSSHGEGTP